MPLRLSPRAGADMGADQIKAMLRDALAPVEAGVAEANGRAEAARLEAVKAEATGQNARQMVLNDRPKLTEAQTAADAAAAKAAEVDSRYDTLQELAASYAQALPASVEDRAALHRAVDALTLRMDNLPAPKDGKPGTANLTIGMRPVGALLLGASTTITVPLSRPMPDLTYRVEMAHSAVVTLAAGMLEVTAKTTTSVTVKVTAVGIALAAGTLLVVAI